MNGDGGGRSAALFREFGLEVEGALDDVRSLAQGIYPSPLADYGLVEGLRSAARHAALPTAVRASAVGSRALRTSAAPRPRRTRRSTPAARRAS